MAGWIGPLVLFLILAYVGTTYLGITGLWLTVAFAVGVLALLKYLNVGFVKAFPFNKRMSGIVALVAIGYVALSLGWLSMLGLQLPTAAVTLPAASVAPTTSTACSASVSEEIRGTSATVTFNAWDKESDTPYSATVNPSLLVFKNGNYVGSASGTSGSVSNVKVGDVLSVYANETTSASYYMDALESLCIDGQQITIDLDAHTRASESNMQITGYDDTEATALSAGTNSSQEDYDITMGASETATFYLKIKTNDADEAFRLGGVALLCVNDCEDVDIQSSGFTKIPTPDAFENVAQIGGTAADFGSNLTQQDYDVYTLNTPILLSEWDSEKYQFEVESSSTDPSTTNTFSSSDMVIACFIDTGWTRGDDGKMYLDVYQHDSAESNVGVIEDIQEPVGKSTCTVIELI